MLPTRFYVVGNSNAEGLHKQFSLDKSGVDV